VQVLKVAEREEPIHPERADQLRHLVVPAPRRIPRRIVAGDVADRRDDRCTARVRLRLPRRSIRARRGDERRDRHEHHRPPHGHLPETRARLSNARRWSRSNRSGIEALLGSQHDDTLTGDAVDNTILGRAGDDTLTGDAVDNTILGRAGDDTLDGVAGTDVLDGGNGAGACLNREDVSNREA
jgi:hypothetical protein